MSKWREYKEGREVFAHLPYKTNGCVAVAVARCLADDPSDDVEVGGLAGLVNDTIPQKSGRGFGIGMDEQGAYFGGVGHAMKACGIDYLLEESPQPKVVEDEWGWERTKTYHPTAASFFRANPEIREAVVCTNGHAAYYRDGVGFRLSARHRVLNVYVLKVDGDPKALRARLAAERKGLTVEQWRETYVSEVEWVESGDPREYWDWYLTAPAPSGSANSKEGS